MHFLKSTIPSAVVILTLAILSSPQVSAFSCSCKTNSFRTEQFCFCDSEADKVFSCVKQKLPNWPFVKDANLNMDCPVTDSAGFNKCIQDQVPKPEDMQKSQQTVSDCISSTGAKPTQVDDNPKGGVTTSTTQSPPAQSSTAQFKNSGFKMDSTQVTLLSLAGFTLFF